MNYDLALKLKEAGFPQTFPQKDFMELHDALEVQKIYDKYPEQFDPYQPTLSELIEACGESFHAVERKEAEPALWVSYGHAKPNELGITAYLFKTADSPEEAVANLWLELNNK